MAGTDWFETGSVQGVQFVVAAWVVAFKVPGHGRELVQDGVDLVLGDFGEFVFVDVGEFLGFGGLGAGRGVVVAFGAGEVPLVVEVISFEHVFHRRLVVLGEVVVNLLDVASCALGMVVWLTRKALDFTFGTRGGVVKAGGVVWSVLESGRLCCATSGRDGGVGRV